LDTLSPGLIGLLQDVQRGRDMVVCDISLAPPWLPADIHCWNWLL
jgi:hypothetical protein